jgi:hypothetical protein
VRKAETVLVLRPVRAACHCKGGFIAFQQVGDGHTNIAVQDWDCAAF